MRREGGDGGEDSGCIEKAAYLSISYEMSYYKSLLAQHVYSLETNWNKQEEMNMNKFGNYLIYGSEIGGRERERESSRE